MTRIYDDELPTGDEVYFEDGEDWHLTGMINRDYPVKGFIALCRLGDEYPMRHNPETRASLHDLPDETICARCRRIANEAAGYTSWPPIPRHVLEALA